jgi:oligopeptide transport system substrate-binding protein
MIGLNLEPESTSENINTVPLSFHPSFVTVNEKLKKWVKRFPFSCDNSIFNDLTLLYLLATKKYLDHRHSSHLFRLVLSSHLIQKKLIRSTTLSPHLRHLEIRLTPTNLSFPFSSKPVLGCLIGFNLMDRYELFDEENIVLALQKYLPQLQLVKESSYSHTSQHKNLKIFYFEIEQKNGTPFSFLERSLLKNSLEEKVRKSIQPLSPTIFMRHNNEEIYKNILVLSQEIQSIEDIPQAYITLDQQTGKEIVFRVNLVHISPFHHFSLKDCFSGSTFVSERVLTVRFLKEHPIQAHIFCLHLPRTPSLLRADGSLDFYAARQKVVAFVTNAIGEFRDYNGGILIKQQELLDDFKENFPEISNNDPELLEAFFYALIPLEKQVVLPLKALSTLFTYFLENRKNTLPKDSIYSFKVHHNEQHIFLTVQGDDSSLIGSITSVLQDPSFTSLDIAYNHVHKIEGVFFNCAIMQVDSRIAHALVQAIQESLNKWHQKMKDRQVLKIGLGVSVVVSLDPRIGGDAISVDILRLLFEGLTRFSQNGEIENAVAESIEISSNSTQYTFKLRSAFWNDGSPLTAYDFEYAGKKILSPDFKTAFTYLFYPIKNAKEAKEGKVPPEQIGIKVLDDHTLVVELENPIPYFLQLIAHPHYSPIHRLIDQRHPQWPYGCEKNYPCNGPFQLKINQPNQGYHLVKNPNYLDADNILLDQIVLTQMNPLQAFQGFQKKEIDWLGNPFGAWDPLYKPGNDDQVISLPNTSVCWFVFNTRQSLFHHCKLRQAFAYAIQRDEIVANAFLPLNPAYSPLLPHFHEKNAHSSLFPKFNPEMARQLLDEVLGEIGLQKKDIPPLTLIFTEKGVQKYTALCLQQQLQKNLGIECELKPLPWNMLFRQMTEGYFQLGIMNWFSWINDPIYTLNDFRSAKQKVNFAKWENSDFQHLLSLSEKEGNVSKRSSYLLKAEEILTEEMPIIPLFYQPYQALANKGLHVDCQNPYLSFNLAKSFFKKDVQNVISK